MSTILVGVTGGIAAYKTCQLVSNLVKKGHDVQVLMTQHACEFVTPLTFQTLSKNKVTVDSFDMNYMYDVHHISQAKKADCFVIAPASANVIAKVANGIADDALTTTFLACKCAKVIAPAMNTQMLENPITQANIQKCHDYGYTIVESESGVLACGDNGKGRLADIELIEQAVEYALVKNKPFKGKNVLVNAGCTQEAIDPVRFISNHSTGKMGVEIAKVFAAKGANVTLVLGPSSLKDPFGVQTIRVTNAMQMAEECIKRFKQCDIAIYSGAIADYTPNYKANQKIKKQEGNLSIECERTQDILAYCGSFKSADQILVGFAMETNNLEEYALNKCIKKNADLIVANTINGNDEGFGANTNRITLFNQQGSIANYFGTKHDVANKISEEIEKLCY